MAADGGAVPFKVKVKHNKDKLEVEVTATSTVGDLKADLQKQTGIPVAGMKLTAAKIGLLADDAATMDASKITAKTVFMVTGTSAEEAAKAQKRPASADLKEEVQQMLKGPTNICEETEHAKLLKSGPPEDPEFPAAKGAQVPLPVDDSRTPYIRGVLNKKKQGVRLRILSKEQQVVIATESDQNKLPFGAIKNIVSFPITAGEGKWDAWHIVEIQLHASAQSKIHLYWFPGQYIRNLKQIILGFGF